LQYHGLDADAMASQFLPMAEPDVHPGGPGWTPRAGEGGGGVPLLLARQEADLVSLAHSRQKRRVQRAPSADDLAPLEGESRLEMARETRWLAIPGSSSVGMGICDPPGRKHNSIADRQGGG
jgi:hypothetical protein